MQIKSIDINGLFGTFDYQIELPQDHQPLIITGLNGYGKTTLLNIVYALATCDLYYFFLLPFEHITVSFTDGQSVQIDKIPKQTMEEIAIEEDLPEESDEGVRFTLLAGNDRKGTLEIREADIPERVYMAAAMRHESIQIGAEGIRTKEFHQLLKTKKYLYDALRTGHGAGGNALLITLYSLTVCYLDDKRIMQTDADTDLASSTPQAPLPRNTVIAVSEAVKQQLEKANGEYVEKAQEIDSTLVAQLLHTDQTLDKAEYEKRKLQLDEKIQKLKQCDLTTPANPLPYNPNIAGVLSVFLNNLETKVEVYQKMLGKINLFNKQLAKLKLVNKTINLSRQHGLTATAADGSNIRLEDLSSGEQNQLIILYSLIFLKPDHAVFLIDEPEDSLHIEWQADFLDNLEEIAQTKQLQTIVVTHSPYIIGGRWDTCYDLTEQTGQNQRDHE